jgi:1-acyl-sn-glycerol-3-phosphate acyltransferase
LTLPRLHAAAGAIRASLRIMLVCASLLAIAADTAFSSVFGEKGKHAKLEAIARRRSRYCSVLLHLMGGRLVVKGKPPTGPSLIVANHHSWMDGLAIAIACAPAFIAYSRDWPIIGFIAKRMGVVMIPRGAGSGLVAALEAVRDALMAGDKVCVFPEATTSFGPVLLEFKPAFFQAAIDARVPVVPAALGFSTPTPWPSPERVLHWVDWTPFHVHAARALALPRFEMMLEFGSPLEVPASDATARGGRKQLATKAQASVAALRVTARRH